ncbi:hypothetical protein [Yersinia intermedia]|uniref:hypothetical protein n=1 Tax=Yersinia intermedia TaxID=631 RepID=UPI0030CE63CE
MKKLKFYLSHILFFFFGVMVTVVLLWVLYKDPTRITAPALAALTAMCTFLLALWSAFKVNKWLNSKVNDAAFKQTEKIIETIAEIMIHISKIKPNQLIVKNISNIITNSEKEPIKNICNELKTIDSLIDRLSIQINGLKYFNAELTKDGEAYLDGINNIFNQYRKQIYELQTKVNGNNDLIDNDKIKEIDDCYMSFVDILTNYKESPMIHINMFRVGITSPVEKTSE